MKKKVISVRIPTMNYINALKKLGIPNIKWPNKNDIKSGQVICKIDIVPFPIRHLDDARLCKSLNTTRYSVNSALTQCSMWSGSKMTPCSPGTSCSCDPRGADHGCPTGGALVSKSLGRKGACECGRVRGVSACRDRSVGEPW